MSASRKAANQNGSLTCAIQDLTAKTWLPVLLAVLGGMVYLFQAFRFSHTADLTMDEGTYLMKGWLFANGEYRPFQPYGPWTQKMPLAYLLPGFAQVLFGEGLRTGRYLAVILGLASLAGAWLLSKRFAGRWAAALTIWFFALNSANIFNYSQAITQVMVVFFSIWAMVLILGSQRTAWQVSTGGVLLAALILTRQNLLPFLAFALLYIFFEHGRRKGLLALAAALLTLGLFHVLYWPDILSAWTIFPQSLTPFLDRWRLPADAVPTWQINYPPFGLLDALMEGLLFNLPGLTAITTVILFWPYRKKLKTLPNGKAVLFLVSSFGILFITHAYAAFGPEYGAYSLTTYYSFSRYLANFSFLGWFSLVLAFPYLVQAAPSRLRDAAAALVFLAASACIGLGAYRSLVFTTTIQVPRIRDMRFLPGTVDLWRLLANKYHLDFTLLQRVIPALFTLAIGAGLVILVWLARYLRQRTAVKSPPHPQAPFGFSLLAVFLSLALALSPTEILSKNIQLSLCDFDVLEANEEVGAYLREIIPPGSLVYWHSDISPTPLLYLEDLRIFPAQLDQDFTIFLNTEPQVLERLGFWSPELAEEWQSQADFMLLIDKYVLAYMSESVHAGDFTEIRPLETPISCRNKAIVHIFQRSPRSP